MCTHPLGALSVIHDCMYLCMACGTSSSMGTLEGRPLRDAAEVDVYRRAHPETLLGTAAVECGTCAAHIEITTSFTLMLLLPVQEPPLRWESLVLRNGAEVGQAPLYATAGEAGVAHTALQAAAETHALCVLAEVGGSERA